MRDAGGFEGNGQTLRILSKLETFSKNSGSDLTRRALLGTLKYPVSFSRANNTSIAPRLLEGTSVIKLIDRKASKPPKCYMDCEQDVVDWVLQPLGSAEQDLFSAVTAEEAAHGSAVHKSFYCSIMDLADGISFGIHDFEDMIALSLITEDDFRAHVSSEACAAHLDVLKSTYPDDFGNDVYGKLADMLFRDSNSRKHAISRMVGFFIHSCSIVTLKQFQDPMVRYRAKMAPGAKTFLKALKDIVFKLVILSPSVQHLEFKGQQMVVAVFEALNAEPKALLPRDTLAKYNASGGSAPNSDALPLAELPEGPF